MTTTVTRLVPREIQVEPLWGIPEVATYLGVSAKTIRNRRAMGAPLPPAMVVGRLVRWEPDAVRAWMRAQAEDAA